MNKKPHTIIAAEILILLNALVWFGFATLLVFNLHPALPDSPAARWIMGILAFGCASTLVALTILIEKHFRPAYYAALGLLALLILLTGMDQVGLVDLIYLALTAAPSILLIKDRSWYLGAPLAAGDRSAI
jgi:hypothetical protein